MSKIRSVCARIGTSGGPASKDDPPGVVEQPANTPPPSSDACSSPRRLSPPCSPTSHLLQLAEASKIAPLCLLKTYGPPVGKQFQRFVSWQSTSPYLDIPPA